MIPSAWLYDFLKYYERFRPTAYPATAAERRRGIWTIGYGHTRGVKEGDTCTLAQANEWLHQDATTAAVAVNRLVKVPLNQNQYDALVSLCFNIGVGAFEESTLLRKLNAGGYAGAQAEFKRWDRQAAKELPGLERRRVAEANHFGGVA